LVEYAVYNANVVYFDDKLVSPSSGTEYFSQFVELPTSSVDVHIKAQNMYLNNENTFTIRRKKSEAETKLRFNILVNYL
jgi:hypothetical protein